MSTLHKLSSRYIYLSIIFFTYLFLQPSKVFAEDLSRPENTLTQETLTQFNPLVQFGQAELNQNFTTPAGVLNRILLFAFPLAGLILFVMLIWAGFEIVAGATDKKALDSGKQRATAAVIGFMLLFTSYWFVQLLEVIFGVQIL